MATYTGNALKNSYVGTAQDDDIDMRAGDDIAYGQGGDDIIHGGWGEDSLHGGDDNDTIYGEDDNDLLFGDAGDDVLDGGEGDDTLRGGDDNDTLRGGNGNDILRGGEGNDVLIGGNGFDEYLGEDGDDFIDASLGFALDIDGGVGIDTLSYRNATSGIELNMILQGALPGVGGGVGGAANDDLFVGIENIQGSAFADEINGDNNANVLSGLNGDDRLDGGGGDDVLDGGAGADFLKGGAGFDTATYASSNAAISINLTTGVNQGGLAQGDTLNTIERIVGSNFADTIIGRQLDETFDGNNGNDLIDGAAGTDTIDMSHWSTTTSGGLFDAFSITLAEAGNDGSAVRTEIQFLHSGSIERERDTLRNIENVIGSDKGETIAGNGQNNVIDGNGGNDIINGGLGQDTINGGDGNDTIEGGGGADVIDGGAGIDTASYAGSAERVLIDLLNNFFQLGDSVGDDLRNIENLTGSAFGDELIGDNGINVLRGGNGQDLLVGLGGADTLDGGAGEDDAANYGSSASAVTVNLATGVNSGGDAQGDILIGIEDVFGSNADDTITGDGNDNGLNGGNGNDVLNGGGGADTLRGDLGDDRLDGGAGLDTARYFGVNAAVTVNLAVTSPQNTGGAGIDTLVSIENVTGGNGNDTITGNGAVNELDGSLGNDSLDGGAGADRLDGGNGTDTASYAGSSAGVNVNLAAGTATGGDAAGDTLISIENLIGSNFGDVLAGNAGANVLTGGAGADGFVFNTALNAATNVDTITDFSLADGDTILLDDAIFTGLGAAPGNSITAQDFRIGSAAQDADDRIIYNDVTGALLFDADGIGGAAAVQFATLSPGLALTNGLIGII
jgi:Ca2+-binding RTX toxin-like protein